MDKLINLIDAAASNIQMRDRLVCSIMPLNMFLSASLMTTKSADTLNSWFKF